MHLFLEQGVFDLDAELDRIVFLEPGNRTTYFDDLVRWGCAIDLWADHDALVTSVLSAATEPSPART